MPNKYSRKDVSTILNLIGRTKELFVTDINQFEQELAEKVESSCFLVLGGAGSIGQAVVKEIFKRNPKSGMFWILSEKALFNFNAHN